MMTQGFDVRAFIKANHAQHPRAMQKLTDHGGLMASVQDQISAIDKEIAAREEEFEKSIAELRETRQKLVSDRVKELRAELASLGASVGSSRGSARRGGGRSSMDSEERKTRILEFVRSATESGGTNAKLIADELGVSAGTVTRDLEELQGSGQVVREGERRATRYKAA